MLDKTLSLFKRLLKLPQYLHKLEKIIVLGLSGVILISTGFLVFDRFFVQKSTLADYGGTYIEGGAGEVNSLIPILKQSDLEKDVSKLIFSSLVKYNGKREIVGDIASKWEISPDGKIYTFYLKEVKWQGGNKLTSEDIIFTLSLIQNEQTKSPFFESFREVKIKKIDDKTISLELKTPLAPFLGYLTIPILPKHLISQIPPSQLLSSQFAKNPIGSGPFKLEKIETNKERTSVVLKANKDYYFKKPYLTKFIFKIYQDQEEAQKAFFKKQILGLFEGEQGTDKSYKVILPQYKAIFFNLDSPSLDRDFRKALALFVNKAEIIEAVGDSEKIDFPILPGFLGYKESERWDFNLEKAKKFLSKSKSPKEKLILLTSHSQDNQKIVEILKKQWENLGVKIEIEVLTNALFEKALSSRNYDLLLLGVNQKADPDPYPFWHSSQTEGTGLNFSSFKNKEVDKLLEEARQSMDQNLRRQRYERFIDLIQSEVPAIFLYQPIYNYSISGIIKGVGETQGVTKSDRFWNVGDWYIKTKGVKR